jgi:hypothetical protein
MGIASPPRRECAQPRLVCWSDRNASPSPQEHDPEKWMPVFPRDKRLRVCAEIMLQNQCFRRLGCAKSAAAHPAAQALKAVARKSARPGVVNRKIDKLTRLQAVAAAW